MAGIVFAEHQLLADQYAKNDPQRVEDLRKVDALGGGFQRPQQAGVGIGGGFQERQPGGDHSQAGQEGAVGHDLRCRDKQETAESVQAQADHDRHLVRVAFDHRRGGQSHHEVAEEEDRLHQRGLGIRQIEPLLELGDQDVVQVAGHAPQGEQAADQHQLQPGRGGQIGAAVDVFGRGVLRHVAFVNQRVAHYGVPSSGEKENELITSSCS